MIKETEKENADFYTELKAKDGETLLQMALTAKDLKTEDGEIYLPVEVNMSGNIVSINLPIDSEQFQTLLTAASA